MECRNCGERLRSINICGLMAEEEELGLNSIACPRNGIRGDCPLPQEQRAAVTHATPLVNTWWPSGTRVEISTTRTRGGESMGTTQLVLEV